jgi:chemotaxis protein CheC
MALHENISFVELSKSRIDILKEIGNVGAGNAATSLSALLDEEIHISLPNVRIEDFNQVVNRVGGPEEIVVAVLVPFEGELSGVVLYMQTLEDAKGVAEVMVGIADPDLPGLSDIKLSALKEIGNILSSSWLNCVSTLTGMTVKVSIPYASVDMAGAILASPAIEYGGCGDKVLYIEETFCSRRRDLRSSVIVFVHKDALAAMMDKLDTIQE